MTIPLYCRELRAVYGPSSAVTPPDNCVKDSKQAVLVVQPLLETAAEEHALVILLDARHQLIALSQVSSGGVSGMSIDPKVVFRAALLANASGLIFLHNHPSGDPTPSAEDVVMTRRLRDAGEIIGCQLLDSIVIGAEGRFMSFRDQGRLS